MIRGLLICIAMVMFFTITYGQKITMIKTFGGIRFERDSTAISPKQVLSIMYMNSEAYSEFRLAKRNYSVAGVLGFAGGVLIGFPLGTALAGGEPEWSLAAGGAVLLLASIPINIAFKRHAKEAVDIYNMGVTTSRIRPSLHIQGNQVGLVIKF